MILLKNTIDKNREKGNDKRISIVRICTMLSMVMMSLLYDRVTRVTSVTYAKRNVTMRVMNSNVIVDGRYGYDRQELEERYKYD